MNNFKKLVKIVSFFLFSLSLFSSYKIGDICEDLSWIDNNGNSTSIYEQVDEGKGVMIFFGNYG